MSTPSPQAPTTFVVAVRAAALLVGVTAGGSCLLALALPSLGGVHAAAPLSFVDALEALCAAVTVLCWAWLQLSVLLVASAAVAGACRTRRLAGLAERASRRATPAAVRRLLLACCGVALSGTAVLPASAVTTRAPDSDPVTVATTSLARALSGLPLPDRQTGAPEPSRWVTVRPGDSLWVIARDLLSPGADDRQVSAAWHRIAAANRSLLGAHPDLIHPGTRLRVPAHRRDGL